MSLPSSIQERRPRSHSTSPLFQSHSAEDSDDGQSNGYQGVNAPQQHEAVEMTRLNYSKRDVSPVLAVGVLMLSHISNASCGPDCGPEFFMNMIPNSSIGTNTSNLPSNNFTINIADYANIQAYLSELFSTGWDELGSSTRYNFSTDDSTTTNPTAPDVGRELANAVDLNQTIHAIADSMTESIRTNPNSTAQPGLSYVEKTIMEIRWGWIAYPLTLMVMTLVVLVVMIVQTQKRGVVPWKSSALALLFHGLEGWKGGPGSRAENMGDLERVARRMRGRLAGDGWEAGGEGRRGRLGMAEGVDVGGRLAFVKAE